jgi:hypothetical protein
MKIRRNCVFCKNIWEVTIKAEDIDKFFDGNELVQNAFPYLSADEREMLISGICPDCWNGMFGQEEDEEDPDEDWGYNEDMGFDPYLGCYTDDC